jgi:hypothetical protein
MRDVKLLDTGCRINLKGLNHENAERASELLAVKVYGQEAEGGADQVGRVRSQI